MYVLVAIPRRPWTSVSGLTSEVVCGSRWSFLGGQAVGMGSKWL